MPILRLKSTGLTVTMLALSALIAACGDGYSPRNPTPLAPHPKLPQPIKSLIPTVKIARPKAAFGHATHRCSGFACHRAGKRAGPSALGLCPAER